MNLTTAPGFLAEMTRDLREYVGLCGEVHALVARENKALTEVTEYQAFEFYHQRRDLLPRLENALILLRKWRHAWAQTDPVERANCSELKSVFQTVQDLLMKVLLLDRENQHALLRRGLVPANHLPPAASQQPHYVAGLYRRNATSSPCPSRKSSSSRTT